MVRHEQIRGENITYNNSPVNPNDPINSPGTIRYTVNFISENGISSNQEIALNLPADLFRTPVSLSINPLPPSVVVNTPMNVIFNCSDTSVSFLIIFRDLDNTTNTPIPPPRGTNQFTFTPRATSGRCVFEIFARDPSGRVLATATSTQFSITPPLPPRTNLTIERINDFTINESRTNRFNYTGPAVDHFVIEFIDSEHRTRSSSPLIRPPVNDFNFTAPSLPSNNCMFVITAISSTGTQLAQTPSNPFRIIAGSNPLISINPIPNLAINSNYEVTFNYTGPAPTYFSATLIVNGRNQIQQRINRNDRRFTIRASPESNNCYVSIDAWLSKDIKLGETARSNVFKITNEPLVPQNITINPVRDTYFVGETISTTFNSSIRGSFRAEFIDHDNSRSSELRMSGNQISFQAPAPLNRCSIRVTVSNSNGNKSADSNFFRIIEKGGSRPLIIQIIQITNLDYPPELIQLFTTFLDLIRNLNTNLSSLSEELKELRTLIIELIRLLKENTDLDNINQTIIAINSLLLQLISKINNLKISQLKKQQYINQIKIIINQINIIIDNSNKNTKPRPSGVRNPYFEVRVGGQVQNSDEEAKVKLSLDLSSSDRGSVFIKNIGPRGNLSWYGIVTPYPFENQDLFRLSKKSGSLGNNREDIFEVIMDRDLLSRHPKKNNLQPSLQIFIKGGRVPGLFGLFSHKKSSKILIPIRFQ